MAGRVDSAESAAMNMARGLVAALTVAALVARCRSARSTADDQASPRSPEYVIKAAYLYNFAMFVEWPPDAFAGPDSPLRHRDRRQRSVRLGARADRRGQADQQAPHRHRARAVGAGREAVPHPLHRRDDAGTAAGIHGAARRRLGARSSARPTTSSSRAGPSASPCATTRSAYDINLDAAKRRG